jgi:hypothetical protein
MRMRLIAPAFLAFALAFPSPAMAWHRDGHHAIARMAWKQLDAKQQIALGKILKAHPHYQIYFADGRPRDLLTEMEWAFLQSATWADWVRSPHGPGLDAEKRNAIKRDFNKPVWHYVDLPYIHPKDMDKFDVASIRKTILEPAYGENGEPRHALAALEQATKRLRAANTSDADRAVALCWLMHVGSDLHQPLHGTSLIAAKETLDPPLDPPGGDLGGNLIAIKVKADDARAVNLHFYWDRLLFNDEPGFAGVDGVAAKLLADPKYRRDQFPELKETEFLAWAEESLALAKAVVYAGKDGFLKVRTLPLSMKPSMVGLDAPELPDSYRETAEKAAARRMVLAGYRLADQLQIALRATH